MKLLKRCSLPGLAAVLLASTLPTACQMTPSTATPTPSASASGSTGAVGAQQAAVTGIIYTGRGTDGRLVPPVQPVTVQVLDGSTEVKSVKSDALGRFYIDGIPAPTEGKDYTVKVGTLFERVNKLFPGRVLNLSSIESVVPPETNLQTITRVTGILVDVDGNPIGNVTVRDKVASFRTTTTDAAGRFSLEVTGQDLEVLAGLVPITIAVEEFDNNATVEVDTTNIRTITGTITDSTNTNVLFPRTRIKVQGKSVSVLADANGKFELSGAPVEPFILEVETPTGYAPFSVEIPPATFDSAQRPQPFEQNISLSPVGSIQINFTAESAPGFDQLPCSFILNAGGGFQDFRNPQSAINCFPFTLTGFNGSDIPEYDNTLAVNEPLTAFVTIEGSNNTQTITYPAAPFRILYGEDDEGNTVRVSDRAKAPNVVMSVKLDNVPGGRQSVTVSMTGFQTQKSIPVYIPPNDTISTELITLYRVEPISSFGDVRGVLKGTQPTNNGEEIRIVYLDVKQNLNYEPILGDQTNPDLLDAIQEALVEGDYAEATEVTDASGNFLHHEYYLKNVPTGSRIMLAAAMVDDDGDLSDCYIPNTSVLLNVRASQINLAPDLYLTRRPNRFCN
ncbi:MAG: hypothetical protein ACO1RX_03975 [Candidatus Sericytochromatia bacterium]